LLLDGRGTGTWNQLSPQIPALIKASIKEKKVYKFAENRVSDWIYQFNVDILTQTKEATLAHISDITIFFAHLIEAILRGDKLPEGENGYFFLVSYMIPWWNILEKLAARLYARGLVDSRELDVWPSDKVLAEAVGVPVKFAYSMWNSRLVFLVVQDISWLYILIHAAAHRFLARIGTLLDGTKNGTRNGF
jgi:hypothetical protein